MRRRNLIKILLGWLHGHHHVVSSLEEEYRYGKIEPERSQISLQEWAVWSIDNTPRKLRTLYK